MKSTKSTFTILSDGPDGRVPHFYADTDMASLEVVPKADLDELIAALWECMKWAGADTSYADGAQHAYRLGSLPKAAVEAVADLRNDYIEAGGG